MPLPYKDNIYSDAQVGQGMSVTNRPEPVSSPSSAKGPLISKPDGASDHRAFTKGVSNITKVTQGKDSGTAKSPRRKVNNRRKVKMIGPKPIRDTRPKARKVK